MNCHLPKTCVISIVSFVLLYYSAAWAVLRCVHEEGHSDHAVALVDTDVRDNNAYPQSPSHAETHIDCLNLTFHTESLAGPSSSPQLQSWETQTDSPVADFLTSPSVTNSAEHPSLRTVFERSPGLTFLLYSPLYLSLSILRV
jgi:hypothetical protein